MVKRLALLLLIREVLYSNLGSKTDYGELRYFPQSL